METSQFESTSISAPIRQAGKKVYSGPRLTEWGSLKDITKGSTGLFLDSDHTTIDFSHGGF